MVEYPDFKDNLARSQFGTLNSETIEEVINRMADEAFQYLDIEEFISFFTLRGRPKYKIIYQAIMSDIKSRNNRMSSMSKMGKKRKRMIKNIWNSRLKLINYISSYPKALIWNISISNKISQLNLIKSSQFLNLLTLKKNIMYE